MTGQWSATGGGCLLIEQLLAGLRRLGGDVEGRCVDYLMQVVAVHASFQLFTFSVGILQSVPCRVFGIKISDHKDMPLSEA